MKIAVPTNDGINIASHFGRARNFAIFEVENGEIASKQIVDSNSVHGRHESEHHHHDAGHHDRFKAAIGDCEVIIAGGMGQRARSYFEQVGIKPVFTDISDAAEAVKAYSQGTLKPCDTPDCGHHH